MFEASSDFVQRKLFLLLDETVDMILRYLKFLFLAILLVALFWATFNYKLVAYGWAQFKGQWHIVYNARPLDEVLKDSQVSDSLKLKIQFIEKVSRYAQDSLGLKKSKNYTTLYDQHNKPLLWVLTASEKFQLKSYEWHFPVLGDVSYKGYFDYSIGVAEDSIMKTKGFDTDYGEVSAWSTLGWFKDPILSNMLKRSEGQLAELIIHEMTHATVYVKSNVDFNENLASMIGEEGAIRFLTSTYGKDSDQLKEYIYRKEDYDRFAQHMIRAHHALDSLYKEIASQPDSIKAIKKDEMIASIVESLDTVNFHHANRYSGLFEQRKPNNAYFLNYIRYDSQKDKMKTDLFQLYGGNILRYLNSFK